jgi:hypothetical protein
LYEKAGELKLNSYWRHVQTEEVRELLLIPVKCKSEGNKSRVDNLDQL